MDKFYPNRDGQPIEIIILWVVPTWGWCPANHHFLVLDPCEAHRIFNQIPRFKASVLKQCGDCQVAGSSEKLENDYIEHIGVI